MESIEHSATAKTPFDTFNQDTLSKVLEAVDHVTPVYVYSE